MIDKDTNLSFCDKNHFEILKGIAIVLVITCHMMGNSGVAWFTPLGGIGVAIFLFCSGYGVYYSLYKNRGGTGNVDFLRFTLSSI